MKRRKEEDMATSSPAPSNILADAAANPATPASLQRIDGTTPKTLRGLNKPKCIQCGNVARSRCPYQSCKSCCSKAQNPCLIHVLKANATIPDKALPSNIAQVDHQSVDLSPSTTSLRVASLRQLSNTFSQFNNVHTPRSRKPLTKKEALAINEWRFKKLKEYRDGIAEKETEAFDRYMQNISLLGETFSIKPMQGNDDAALVDPRVSENLRKKKQRVVDEGLRKLEEMELEGDRRPEKVKQWSDRASTFNDLIEKLNKARNEDDLKSCLEINSQLSESHGPPEAAILDNVVESQTNKSEQKASSSKAMDWFSQDQLRPVDIDQETVGKINAHFTSLKIASL